MFRIFEATDGWKIKSDKLSHTAYVMSSVTATQRLMLSKLYTAFIYLWKQF